MMGVTLTMPDWHILTWIAIGYGVGWVSTFAVVARFAMSCGNDMVEGATAAAWLATTIPLIGPITLLWKLATLGARGPRGDRA